MYHFNEVPEAIKLATVAELQNKGEQASQRNIYNLSNISPHPYWGYSSAAIPHATPFKNKSPYKKKLKENVDEKMRFQDLPADPEKYKIVRDSKNYIIKATNADGVEFQKGDVVKTYDGEEIKIAKEKLDE